MYMWCSPRVGSGCPASGRRSGPCFSYAMFSLFSYLQFEGVCCSDEHVEPLHLVSTSSNTKNNTRGSAFLCIHIYACGLPGLSCNALPLLFFFWGGTAVLCMYRYCCDTNCIFVYLVVSRRNPLTTYFDPPPPLPFLFTGSGGLFGRSRSRAV